jgi:DNA-binding MarR family transcriptional regulator
MQMLDSLSRAEQMALADVTDCRLPVWVVADEAHQVAEMQTAAEAGGARIARRLSIEEADGVLCDRPYGTLLMLDLGTHAATGEAHMLDRINFSATDHAQPAVISFPPEAIDRVSASISAPYASLLCAPSVAERVAAIGLARIPVSRHLNEVDGAVDAVRLQQLAEEVGRIARALANFGGPGLDDRPTAVSDGLIGYRAGPAIPRSAPSQVVRSTDIRAMLRLRRQRDYLFAGDLFADPAWDMMLDLMAAKIERLKVAVSSLCIAAAVPPTTALRWIRTLTDLGIFVRVSDPTDGRRVFIELSEAAATKILDYLGEAKRAGVGVV